MTQRALLIAGLIVALLVLWLLHPALVLIVIGGSALAWLMRRRSAWLQGKLIEWRNDLRQLVLYAKLAFSPGRDAQATATMAHQHQFLQGRILSPVNVFTLVPVVIGLVGILYGGVQNWRVERVERQRDAACSERELSRNDEGEFRTTRAACASLGATGEVVAEWQRYAGELKTEHEQLVADVRRENAADLVRAQAAEERRHQTAARTRRRENEAIEAVLGGAAPDLERSLCELAGGVDCGASAGDSAPAASAADDLPSGASDASSAANPVAP